MERGAHGPVQTCGQGQSMDLHCIKLLPPGFWSITGN